MERRGDGEREDGVTVGGEKAPTAAFGGSDDDDDDDEGRQRRGGDVVCFRMKAGVACVIISAVAAVFVLLLKDSL